jgi:hypothetical protein
MKKSGRRSALAGSLTILALSCSDFGSEPWASWKSVDLPGSVISIPSDMHFVWAICDPTPCNPFWSGTGAGGKIDIELDLYSWSRDLADFRSTAGYWESSTLIGGLPALTFGCPYESRIWWGNWHYAIGVLVYGLEDQEPLMLFARLESRLDTEYARQILLSIRSKPGAILLGGLD